MSTLVTTVHIITCILITIVVLLQSGKGAEISASFDGSSQTVFGSSGGANFFTRLTLGLAAVFMTTSLTLTWMNNKGTKSVFDGATAPISAPAGATVPGTNAPGAASVPATAPGTTETKTEKPAPGKPADAADVRGQAKPVDAAPAAAAGTTTGTTAPNN